MAVTQQFVLDTSAYSSFLRGNARLRVYFSAKNTILIPLIVIGELRAGFAAGNREQDNEMRLRKFLDSPNVEIAALTDETTRFYAAIYARLRAAGAPINTNDMWIAALALEYDKSLLTLDTDFSHVKDLVVAKI